MTARCICSESAAGVPLQVVGPQMRSDPERVRRRSRRHSPAIRGPSAHGLVPCERCGSASNAFCRDRAVKFTLPPIESASDVARAMGRSHSTRRSKSLTSMASTKIVTVLAIAWPSDHPSASPARWRRPIRRRDQPYYIRCESGNIMDDQSARRANHGALPSSQPFGHPIIATDPARMADRERQSPFDGNLRAKLR
jgi:hypothetical protein